MARLAATGTLAYSSYHGGWGDDEARGVSLDARGDAVVAGYTGSSALPGSGGAQPDNAGGVDAFVARVLIRPAAPLITAVSPDTGVWDQDHVTSSGNLTFTGTAEPLATVTLEAAGLGVLGQAQADAYGD